MSVLILWSFVSFVFTCLQTKMVKEKPNSIRIYDDEGFRRRAACICVRSDAETEVSHDSVHYKKSFNPQ